MMMTYIQVRCVLASCQPNEAWPAVVQHAARDHPVLWCEQ
jgi:hypothetical protein